jgi:hypothetical protein
MLKTKLVMPERVRLGNTSGTVPNLPRPEKVVLRLSAPTFQVKQSTYLESIHTVDGEVEDVLNLVLIPSPVVRPIGTVSDTFADEVRVCTVITRTLSNVVYPQSTATVCQHSCRCLFKQYLLVLSRRPFSGIVGSE